MFLLFYSVLFLAVKCQIKVLVCKLNICLVCVQWTAGFYKHSVQPLRPHWPDKLLISNSVSDKVYFLKKILDGDFILKKQTKNADGKPKTDNMWKQFKPYLLGLSIIYESVHY